MKITFTLTFTSSEWVCYNSDVELQAGSLDSIDDKMEQYIKANYPSGNYEVDIYFDFDRFPTWYRQYMPHYFNRKLTFNIN